MEHMRWWVCCALTPKILGVGLVDAKYNSNESSELGKYTQFKSPTPSRGTSTCECYPFQMLTFRLIATESPSHLLYPSLGNPSFHHIPEFKLGFQFLPTKNQPYPLTLASSFSVQTTHSTHRYQITSHHGVSFQHHNSGAPEYIHWITDGSTDRTITH